MSLGILWSNRLLAVTGGQQTQAGLIENKAYPKRVKQLI